MSNTRTRGIWVVRIAKWDTDTVNPSFTEELQFRSRENARGWARTYRAEGIYDYVSAPEFVPFAAIYGA